MDVGDGDPADENGDLDYRALFTSIPTAYLVMDRDLVIVEANTAYLTMLDRARDDIVGRHVFEAFPPPADALDHQGDNPVELSFRRTRDHGVADPMPIQKYDITDPVTGEVAERFWSLISAPMVDGDGVVQLVLQRVEDVTGYVRERQGRQGDREWGEAWQRKVETVEADLYARIQELAAAQRAKDLVTRRLGLLAEVALQLTAAGTLEDLERIVIGVGMSIVNAQGGAIISLAADGGWRVTVNQSLGENVQLIYGNVPYDSPLPACWTARTGARLLLPTRASGLAFDPVMASVYENTGRDGWVFLPLMMRGECIGTLAVAWADEHHLRRDELELLDGFAAQCAQALQRIHSAQAEAEAALARLHMSETLQRSLLSQPATPEQLQVAVRYQPAAAEAQVGGDWYDAFVNASGETMLVVGDVSGHDGTAAAAMGQVRNLLRGIAYDSVDGPAVLLSRLDAALSGLQFETMATAVLGRVESNPVGGYRRLRWANAGHLPPMLRLPDGTVQMLEREPNLLLGVDPDTHRREYVVDLVPGSTLLLYTDGLVERRHSGLDDGIGRLSTILTTEGFAGPEILCDALLGSIGAEGNDDDIAMLVMRVDEYGEDVGSGGDTVTETLVLSTDPRSVGAARRFASRLCGLTALTEDERDTAVLLTSEVVTNAVVHGGGGAEIAVTVGPREILVEVADSSGARPVMRVQDSAATNGRGMQLLELASSAWGVRHRGAGKIVWFTLRSA